MEGILKVTPEKLIEASDEFKSTGSTIQSTTNNMLEIINGLGTSWLGEASESYIGQFDKLEDDMEKMHRMINEHVADLQEMAQQYISAEQANVETAQALAGDVIS